MLPDSDRGAGLLMVVAHPDDETIAAGGHLPEWPEARLITITDGSPVNLADARAAGCRTRVGYAALRRREQCAALDIARFPLAHCTWLDFVDQQAAKNLVPLARILAEHIDRNNIRTVMTHPFEGGHPDHDAAAFAVRAAVSLLAQRKPAVLEFACYHQREGRFVSQAFAGEPPHGGVLSEKQRRVKRAMLDAHTSQLRMLANFSDDVERFRTAPEYDFECPPAECWYEQFGWGYTRHSWRCASHDAWHELTELNVLCV